MSRHVKAVSLLDAGLLPDLEPAVRRALMYAINTCGEDGHPPATDQTLPHFTVAYAAQCARTAHQALREGNDLRHKMALALAVLTTHPDATPPTATARVEDERKRFLRILSIHAAACGDLCIDGDADGCCDVCGISLEPCYLCKGIGYHRLVLDAEGIPTFCHDDERASP